MKDAPRLCLLTSSYPRSETDDTSVFIQRIAEAMAKLGAQVDLIVPFDRAEPLEERRNDVSIRRFKYGVFSAGRLAFGASLLTNLQRRPALLLQVPLFILQMLRTLLKLSPRPDGVIAFWILSAVPALCFKLMRGTPYVLSIRGSDALIFKSRILCFLSKPLLRGAKRILVVSSSLSELVRANTNLDPTRIMVVNNGVSVPQINDCEVAKCAEKRELFLDRKYLLSVGSLRPMKRIEKLIEMLPLLTDFELLLVGKTDLVSYVNELRARAEALDCLNRVHFLGSVPPQEVFAYLRLAEWLVSASTWEGQPNAVLEAMANGLPVCVSDIPAHREIIQDGETGIIDSFSSPTGAAQRLSNLPPERKISLAECAAKAVANRSWERCAAEYLKML